MLRSSFFTAFLERSLNSSGDETIISTQLNPPSLSRFMTSILVFRFARTAVTS